MDVERSPTSRAVHPGELVPLRDDIEEKPHLFRTGYKPLAANLAPSADQLLQPFGQAFEVHGVRLFATVPSLSYKSPTPSRGIRVMPATSPKGWPKTNPDCVTGSAAVPATVPSVTNAWRE